MKIIITIVRSFLPIIWVSLSFAQSVWVSQTSGTVQNLNSVFFTSSTAGVVVGDSGTVLRTTDGGTNWSAVASGTLWDIEAVHFADTSFGVAVGKAGADGMGGVLRTLNGGATWNPVAAPFDVNSLKRNFYGVYCTSPLYLSIVGEEIDSTNRTNGILYYSTNGGIVWGAKVVTHGNKDIRYNDVFNIDSVNVVTAYDLGILGQKFSGTGQWTGYSSSVPFYDIYFVGQNFGMSVGASGSIVRTTNQGVGWSPLTSGTTEKLTGLFLISQQKGFAVGTNGTILRTLDSGNSWIVQTSGTTKNLEDVYFPNANSGYAVGAKGTILHTTNGSFVSVGDNKNSFAREPGLGQNFPNPFSSQTAIAVAGPGIFEVRDIVGRVVFHCLIRDQDEMISFDGTNLVNGLYVYSLVNGMSIEHRMMSVLK